MSKNNQNFDAIPDNLKRNWGWLLALGMLFVILGGIGFSMAVGLTLISMIFFGVLLVIAGVSQLVDVFRCKQWKPAFWHALIAVLYVIAGSIVIYDPVLASLLFTMLLAGVLIVIGLSRFMMALSLKDSAGWGWLLFAGLMAIILGVLILIQWPVSGLWVIGLLIAIQMMVDGWSYIFIALAMRRSL